jgi:hypothetical protein
MQVMEIQEKFHAVVSAACPELCRMGVGGNLGGSRRPRRLIVNYGQGIVRQGRRTPPRLTFYPPLRSSRCEKLFAFHLTTYMRNRYSLGRPMGRQ